MEKYFSENISYIIFHEGNISEPHQKYIQTNTIIPLKFIDVYKSFQKNEIDDYPPTKKMGIGDRNVYNFWFCDFWNYLENYDKILRIDEGLHYYLDYNQIFQLLNEKVVVSGWSKNKGFVTKDLNAFTLGFLKKNKINRDSIVPSRPCTNVFGLNLNVLRKRSLLTKYILDIKKSKNIYVYRWEDSCLWGEALHYFFQENEYSSIEEINFFKESHNELANLETINSTVRILNRNGDNKLQRNQKIPYNIIQTFKTRNVPISMWSNLNKWASFNPEYNYLFFDDIEINNYINQNNFTDFNFSKNQFKKAYTKIKPGAGKADLFRLLIIYDKGGCYFDIDTTCITPLSELIESDDEVLSGIGARGDFHQWGLIYIYHHPFIKKALEIAVYNIINERFLSSHKSLEFLSGPPALDRAIKTILNYNIKYKFTAGKYKVNGISYRLLDGDHFNHNVVFKYKGYRTDLKKLGVKYWIDDNIFNTD